MKINLDAPSVITPESYPCLKQSKSTQNIVLFTSLQAGTVILLGKFNTSSDVGEYFEYYLSD